MEGWRHDAHWGGGEAEMETFERFPDGTSVFASADDRMEDLAWRLFGGGGADAMRACQAQVVVLMIGANDYGTKQQSAEAAGEELVQLVKALRGRLGQGPQLLLHAAIVPEVPQEKSEAAALNYGQHLSSVMRTYAAEDNSARFIDCSGHYMMEGRRLKRIFMGYELWYYCLEGYWGPLLQPQPPMQEGLESQESNVQDDHLATALQPSASTVVV